MSVSRVNLLVIYQEIGFEVIEPNVKAILADLRKKRNKYTHGLHRALLAPSYILEALAIFLTDLWEKNGCKNLRQSY
jgi:hypothetical protein